MGRVDLVAMNDKRVTRKKEKKNWKIKFRLLCSFFVFFEQKSAFLFCSFSIPLNS